MSVKYKQRVDDNYDQEPGTEICLQWAGPGTGLYNTNSKDQTINMLILHQFRSATETAFKHTMRQYNVSGKPIRPLCIKLRLDAA